MELPAAAGAVVIGGGVIGCSAAYHLAKMGCPDVVILERRRLTCGTTWHSSGQVRQLRSTRNLTELIRYSARLYASLEAETGQGTGWLQCGSLSIATNPDRLTHVKRQASLARAFDVDVEVIDAGRVGELWPLMRTDDIIGTVYSPTDGRVNPSDLSLALVKGAKAMGVRVLEGVPVTGFSMQNGRLSGVETGAGTIETPVAVDCAGLWGRDVAALAGAAAPLHAVEHFYLLTEPMPGVGRPPVLSDHDGHLYLREEVGGLLVGCFEPGGKAIAPKDLPADFEFDLLNEDWDHFEPMMNNAMHRIPALESARARMLLVGPESFTADGMFLLGESPETPGFFLCCGMNSGGVALAGGVGKALAEWVTDGRPEKELWHADIRRFPPVMNGLKGLRERAPETMMLHFAVAYPDREHDTARDLRLSPLHGRLAKRGARFEQRMAWERPAWFAAPGSEIDEGLCFGKPPWFDRLAAEHRAVREGVAVFDLTSFGKLRIEGGDAEALLGRLAANDVAVPPGRVVYTGFLNEDGGYESDLTLMRLDGDTYLAVTGAARPVRDADWMRGHMDGEAAEVTDVSEEFAVLGVAGPLSRELLSRIGDADFSNQAFPYYTCREIEAAGTTVLAARLSYTGELGWELYAPMAAAGALYDALMEAGEDLGLLDAGMKALTSLRLEAAYRDWGHDLTPDYTAFEAGLGWAVKLDKPVPFIGRDALLRQRDRGVSRRLVVFTMDSSAAYPLGAEPIYHQDRLVGETTSAAFGHTLGRAVALGYVEINGADIGDMIGAGGFELEIACERFPAAASLKAPYDPEGRRPRM